MVNNIEIKKENVLAAYNGASAEQKQLLETLFGKDTFKPQDVTERVKTFEDACRELDIEADKWLQDRAELGFEPDVIAYMKLRIICAALNEGWKPKFTEDEWRYYPWFWLYTQDEIDNMDEYEKKERCLMSTGDYQTGYAGLAYANSSHTPSYSHTSLGSRLCLKSDTLAVYAGKQFMSLWADFYLIRKSK